MKFESAMQLKGWIKNKSKETGAPANVLLQSYMMERLLERVSLSPYRENLILKGGFLIAAMIGVERRSTMDMDATVKGLSINRGSLESVLNDILAIDADDGIAFEIYDMRNIHDISEYDDFRVSLHAVYQTIRVDMKLDITIGDVIIPGAVEFPYRLMFEERTISVMAYNLYTILAEKIETILSRNVANTRGRDFYDAYMLLSSNKDTLARAELLHALRIKAEERGSIPALENHAKHLREIAASPDIEKIWTMYTKNYPYAGGITLPDVISTIEWVFETKTT
jgi:predicted nucleotidyltransferase component of viral defense system